MFMPKYKRIIDDILLKIHDGDLEVGMKLPSQRNLANHYGVNRSTVIQSLEILQSYGVLESKERDGLYVSNSKWNTYINHNMNWHEYIHNSSSKNNQYFIQRINELEFDESLLRLSTGELSPDLIPNEKFRNIFSKNLTTPLNTNYEHPLGNLNLRSAIVDYVKKRGIQCSEDNICVISGALQGLKLIADGLLIPHSKIIIETPSYINSVHTWHNIRADLKFLPISKIKQQINNIFNVNTQNQNNIFYCIPTLHNPTQNSYTQAEKYKLIQQCKQAHIPIVEDDVYGDLWFEHQRPQPLKSLEDSDNILYISSLSKTVSPGLRVGWIIGKPSVVMHLADLKMQNDYGASSLSQFVATEWLKNPAYHEQHLTHLNRALSIRRDKFLDALNKHFQALGTWTVPQGSYYIWFKLNVPLNMKLLFDSAIRHHILINPGEIYDKNARDYIRFSYSYINIEDIDFALGTLSKLIKNQICNKTN
ncbi:MULTISPECIES: PLP-dependent aminotransferase family protein [Staphylococcus]|uniref:Aspartate aminotransferase n=1 Tax=Staphylococcus nepalensis TaxID=214473 RepID=A0A2T4SA15_9STAP|nr:MULTISPECIES: PLP-dependent aminotransferase family protein [Staphylococcus]PTK58786.1 aspartate aminotransferase [Staphylococcus nepalensis]SUM70858.1 bifunctional protein: transcriptional regulator; aminotransferase [Staphylococcus nepalensis]SUM96482.1 bifunctional protein: transcriptional regulator; aminotransferase [Staphylococcus nepalensis]